MLELIEISHRPSIRRSSGEKSQHSSCHQRTPISFTLRNPFQNLDFCDGVVVVRQSKLPPLKQT